MKYELEKIEKTLLMPQLEGIGERLEYDISTLLNRAGIYFRIFYRAKTPYSIFQKINKEGYGFEETDKKMQDLIGLRIVVYYLDDVKILQNVLDKTFCRMGEWAVTDTAQDEFKASKLNGVYRIPEEYCQIYNGDFGELPIDLTIEVQLRTVSFEGWHEIEHD
ncbi:MAG: RelA/SpoT domain-containing protein, partial [Eubacterium sp.]|nr:RelA/SpoT domain-containing protein [Eubacterium sp.]